MPTNYLFGLHVAHIQNMTMGSFQVFLLLLYWYTGTRLSIDDTDDMLLSTHHTAV